MGLSVRAWPAGWGTPRPPAMPPLSRDHRDPRLAQAAGRLTAGLGTGIRLLEWSNRDVRLPAHELHVAWGSADRPCAAHFCSAADHLSVAELQAKARLAGAIVAQGVGDAVAR